MKESIRASGQLEAKFPNLSGEKVTLQLGSQPSWQRIGWLLLHPRTPWPAPLFQTASLCSKSGDSADSAFCGH
eukprot:3508386-Pleurochrysis_carterae.AAC.2